MTTVLRIVTVLVAMAFAGGELMKLAQPKEKLTAQLRWVTEFSQQDERARPGLPESP